MLEKNQRFKSLLYVLADAALLFIGFLLANYIRFNYVRYFEPGGAGPALAVARDPRNIIAGLAQGCGDLEKLADLCARFPGQVRPFDVDLSDRAKVDTFVQVLAASAPAPTHFIHLPALPVVNAKFKAFDQTRFDRDLEIQVHSAVRLCRAVLPAMAKARFGRVLFIQTSYTIGCPPKNTAAYVMAKSAIGGLVKSLAVEYARFGVTVNCVAPSMMETNFLKDTPDLIVQAAAEENPMGRNATPADVVPAMAFLLSDEAGFITGVTLPVTGGSAIV